MWLATDSRPRPIVTTVKMSAICLAPGIDLPGKYAYIGSAQGDILPAEVFNRSGEVTYTVTHLAPGFDGVIDSAAEEYESVRKPGGPVECFLAGTTKPDRDGSIWLRHK